jgi:hypothetical protein
MYWQTSDTIRKEAIRLTYWDFVIIPFVSANQARDVGVDIVSATLEILP